MLADYADSAGSDMCPNPASPAERATFHAEAGQNTRTRRTTTMPAGRPSKYDPQFCDDVVEYMSQGFSRMASAGLIGICYDTFHEWVKQYPEFSEAVKLGMAKRLHFLETGLIMAESGPQVTSRIFALKNAAPEEWQDRKAVDVQSPDGSMSPKGLDVSKLSTSALAELLSAMGEDGSDADEG